MTRAALKLTAFLLAGVTVGLATVGVAVLVTPTREPPECEVIEADVLLHGIDLIRVPGGGDPIPMTGALQNYTRLECNGMDVLVRSDALRASE